MRIAVTGAGGRLGAAVLERAKAAGHVGIPWTREAFDLDAPRSIGALLREATPDVVVHAAAWTDVDGCARQPELALARNGAATGAVAAASAHAGARLIVVSTNEVFDGTRTEHIPYEPDDPTNPANAYGTSKVEGERLAASAYRAHPERLAITRTAWLFGAGKPDFPARIAAAARTAAAEGRPLRVVADEVGTPTFVPDLAAALVQAASASVSGILHIVNEGVASRADWARDVLARLAIDVAVEDISIDDYQRPSRPPRWGVLEPTPIAGAPMRHWRDAMTERMALGGFGE